MPEAEGAPARVRRGLGAGSPAPTSESGSASASVPSRAPLSATPPTDPAKPAPRRGLGTGASAPVPEAESALASAPGRVPRSAAGSAPAEPAEKSAPQAIARRRTATRWLLLTGLLIVVGAVVVVVARLLIGLPAVRAFEREYPGAAVLPAGAPVGIPAWLEWQHFLNAFFLILMIKTGWQVRTQTRPPANWIRDNTGFIRTANPPRKISITLWLHLSLDVLWLVNGVVFVVLLFATGQWMRVIPTSWDVVPNALSAALQYSSLQWPTEDGWVNYNGLQLLSYFVVIFVAAPLAAVTGVRMSAAWPRDARRLNRIYPIEIARAVHFPVMLFFAIFVIVHVTLVLATGALRNLNHMYGGQDAVNWVGAIVFAISIVVMAGAWVAARPLVVAPIAGLFGKVSR